MFRRIAETAALSAIALAPLQAQHKPRPFELSGLPALNFDADEGFGYGVILALYGYSPKSTSYAHGRSSQPSS